MKSMISELTDETNVAQGFSLLPMTWAIGYVIGLAVFSYSRLLVLADILMPFLARLLVASYHDLKIAGQASSHSLSGPITLTSYRVWLRPLMRVYLWS